MATKPFSPGRFGFNVDGENIGYCKSVEIPTLEGDVAEHNLATDSFMAKQVTTFKYGACKVELSLGMGKTVWDWLGAALDKGAISKSCAISIGDFDYKEVGRVELADCQISEVSLPALGADKKESLYLTLGLQPTYTRYVAGSGASITGKMGPKTKNMSVNNFNLSLGDFDPNGVKEIGALKWEAKSQFDHRGNINEPGQIYTKLGRPDLEVTYTGPMATEIMKFADSWFRGGQRMQQHELAGTLELLSPELKPVGEISFEGVGMKKVAIDKLGSNEDKVAGVKVTWYVEQARLKRFEADF
jgi:hypothetical protein